MNYSITITPSVTNGYILNYDDGYRLTIAASNPVNFDGNIFLFLVQPLQAGQTVPSAIFQKICSPRDIAQYPIGQPLPNSNPGWFRTNSFTVDFDNSEDVTTTIGYAYIMVQELLDAMAANDELVAQTPMTFTSNNPQDILL